MRTDAEREDSAVWKLNQNGYIASRAGAGYIMIASDGAEATLDSLAALIELAEAVYERVWTGRSITLSA